MRKRNKSVYVRMSEKEYSQLLEKVKESGMTIQSYIINSSLNGKITSVDEVTEMRNKNILLADMDKQLRGMGTNLNQIAHVANGYGEIPTVKELIRLANEISDIRKEIDEEWRLTRLSINLQKHMEQ